MCMYSFLISVFFFEFNFDCHIVEHRHTMLYKSCHRIHNGGMMVVFCGEDCLCSCCGMTGGDARNRVIQNLRLYIDSGDGG